jgi:hypothetical protein
MSRRRIRINTPDGQQEATTSRLAFLSPIKNCGKSAHPENAKLVERTIAGKETEQCLIKVMHQIAQSLYLGLSLDEFSSESSEILRQCVDISARIECCVKSQSVRGYGDV